jgi:hypothetical protein
MSPDRNRVRTLELAEALTAFANETVASSDDDAWLLLVGVVRDSAAQIRRAATAVGSRPNQQLEQRN